MMHKIKLLSFLFFVTTAAQTQNTIADVEAQLAYLGNRMITAVNEDARLAAADSFADILDAHLLDPDFNNHPLDKVTNLSKLKSPDKNFRIYTWSVPLKNREFNFYGRLVMQTGKGLKAIDLIDGAATQTLPEYQLLKPENWYGAVYYDIIKTKDKKQVYYTLLGYRPSRATYNQKIIDVLNLDNRNAIRFGDKIFETPKIGDVKYKKPPHRLIFRYSPKVTASIRWQEKEKQIMMDHLSVPDISMRGKWELYGPDFSYDALFWKEGKWYLKEELMPKTNQ